MIFDKLIEKNPDNNAITNALWRLPRYKNSAKVIFNCLSEINLRDRLLYTKHCNLDI